jgi:hypothetical protein
LGLPRACSGREKIKTVDLFVEIKVGIENAAAADDVP